MIGAKGGTMGTGTVCELMTPSDGVRPFVGGECTYFTGPDEGCGSASGVATSAKVSGGLVMTAVGWLGREFRRELTTSRFTIMGVSTGKDSAVRAARHGDTPAESSLVCLFNKASSIFTTGSSEITSIANPFLGSSVVVQTLASLPIRSNSGGGSSSDDGESSIAIMIGEEAMGTIDSGWLFNSTGRANCSSGSSKDGED